MPLQEKVILEFEQGLQIIFIARPCWNYINNKEMITEYWFYIEYIRIGYIYQG